MPALQIKRGAALEIERAAPKFLLDLLRAENDYRVHSIFW
jgi:hypothetical protein